MPGGLEALQMEESLGWLHCVVFWFVDAKNIELCRIHCTICDKHIGCGADGKKKAETHIMLDVLICKVCHEFYGDGKFPLDKTDDTEIYCRWCGQGGDQICCSFCPKVFCNVSYFF